MINNAQSLVYQSGRLTKILAVLISISSMLTAVNLDESVKAQSNQYLDAAVETAIILSRLEHRGESDKLYEYLHPDAKELVSERTVTGWYESEFFPLQPQPISQIVSVQYITWSWDVTGNTYLNTAEITFTQPFGTGANQYVVTETVRLVEHRSGQWGWFFGRSSEFVEQQRAIHDPGGSQPEPTKEAVTRTTRGSTTHNCTLVELRPGYPGYRGLVTGLSQQWGGLGDWECLETLERNHPQFNKAEQDRLNNEAARYLGINGDPEVWLWENWMGIEAQRGLPVSCYACLINNPEAIPVNTSITQDWLDVRIQVGFLGSRSAIDIYMPTPMIRDMFDDNYQLRAHAFLIGGPSTNAVELLLIYEEIGSEKHWVDLYAVDYILGLGGYTWISPDAYSLDQEFSIRIAFQTATYLMPPPIQNSIFTSINSWILEWKADIATGSQEPLADFLRRKF